MKYLIAILAGLGAALIAGVIGLALLHGLYEIAWKLDLDGPLRHRAVYHALLTAPALLAFAAMAWRVGRPRDDARAGFKAKAGGIMTTALAGLGGGALGYLTADTYAFEFWKAMSQDGFDLKNALIASLIYGSLLLFGCGIVLGAIHHRRGHTRGKALWAGVAAGGVALLMLFVVMMVAKPFSDSRYERGVHVVARYEIRLPANAAVPAKKDDVRIEMLADGEKRDGHFYDPWQVRDGDRPVLRGFVWLNLPTAQRTLVLSIPGEPKRIFRLALSAKPVATNEFGPWHKVDFIEPRGEPRRAPAGAEPDIEIRYHAN
jgi:hypothetical protein